MKANNPRRAIIVAARRTPIGKVRGLLRRMRVEELAAPVLQALLADAGLTAEQIDDVILGNAAGPGGNIARLSALQAGFPVSVPGVSVDRQCGSGLEAINMAARLIEAGAGEIYIAGGVESASTAPLRYDVPHDQGASPVPFTRARFAPDFVGDPDMGPAAENVARAYGITRVRQDAFALRSHQKAIAAMGEGRFKAEIVPLPQGSEYAVDRDECPRADTTAEKLAALAPVFAADGTVTPGNACPVNDGAAAVLMMSAAKAKQLGLHDGLAVTDSAVAGVDPNVLGIGPVPAVQKLLTRTKLSLADIDLVEFNEAFAAQVLACCDKLGVLEDQLNIGGGAIALGHPYGASGAILVVRLFTELVRRDGGTRGLATLGIGGGMGLASVFERVG
ncbi:MAG: thiolase family protein [Rhodospirillaceae bacterium]|nr:thiolase family protein [Rhodospirillaceae bacterium]